MKRIGIFLVFILLLTGCKETPIDPVVVVECESNQKLVDGVCEDVEVVKDDYDEDLLALLNAFHSDLNAQKIASSKLDFIVTPVIQPLGEESKYRIITQIQYDLIKEYYFRSLDTTVTLDFDYVDYLKKVDNGYEYYLKTADQFNTGVKTLDGSFEDELSSYEAIGFYFENTDDVLSVSGIGDSVFKVTVTKEYLIDHMQPVLTHYLDDFTNNYVVLTIEFKQLDNEYTVSFSMVNDDTDANYSVIDGVLTIKILESVTEYVVTN